MLKNNKLDKLYKIYHDALIDDVSTIQTQGKKRITEAEKDSAYKLENKFWFFLVDLGFVTKINTSRQCEIIFNKDDINDSNKNESYKIDIICETDDFRIYIESSTEKDTTTKINDTTKKFEAYSRLLYDNNINKINNGDTKNLLQIFHTNQNVTNYSKNKLKSKKITFFPDNILDYFIDLSKKYKKLAYYQLLHFLFPIKLARGLNTITKPAILSKDKLGKYFVFNIRPYDIIRFCTVPNRQLSSADLGVSKSYQRLIDNTKLSSIQDYIINDGQFPTNLILNFNETVKINQISGQKKKQFVQIDIEPRYGLINVIDGQHRLFAYIDEYLGKKGKKKNSQELLKKSKSHELTVIAYDNIPVKSQIETFVTVNEKQKPVSKNLLWDLYPEIYDEKNPEYFKVEISNLVKKLNTTKENSLFHKIKYPSAPHGSKSGPIDLNAFCSQIESINFLGKKDLAGRYKTMFNDKLKTKPKKFDKSFYKSISLFFNTSKKLSPKKWLDNKFYCTNQGVQSFLFLFDSIMTHIIQKEEEYIKEDFKELQNLFLKYLKPAQNYIDKMNEQEIRDFKKSNLGGGGPKGIFHVLIKEINAKEENFEKLKIQNLTKHKKFDEILEELKENNESKVLEVKEAFFTDLKHLKKEKEIISNEDFATKNVKIITSMINSGGGNLVIGIKDQVWEDVGVQSTDFKLHKGKSKISDLKESYSKKIQSFIENKVDSSKDVGGFYELDIIEHAGKIFAMFNITEISEQRLNEEKLFSVNKIVHIRSNNEGDRTVEMIPGNIKQYCKDLLHKRKTNDK